MAPWSYDPSVYESGGESGVNDVGADSDLATNMRTLHWVTKVRPLRPNSHDSRGTSPLRRTHTRTARGGWPLWERRACTQVGSLRESIRFYERVFGMRVLRHEEFEHGCEATCNGPYGGRWSKTMVGLGPERSNFAFELTYNYGVHDYPAGNDLQYFAIAMPEVRDGKRTEKATGSEPKKRREAFQKATRRLLGVLRTIRLESHRHAHDHPRDWRALLISPCHLSLSSLLVRQAIPRAMAFGYPVEFNDNGLIGGRQAFDMVHGDSERTYVPAIITGPDEFKYKILSARSGVAERFVAVALRSSNLAATEAYWVNTLGMKKLPPPRGLDRKADPKHTTPKASEEEEAPQTQHLTVGWSANQVNLHFVQPADGAAVSHASAGGRIAFATRDVNAFHQAAEKSGLGAILNAPLTLQTPGKAEVTVTILADPDGYEVCFVDDIGFYALSEPTYDVIDWKSRPSVAAAPPPRTMLKQVGLDGKYTELVPDPTGDPPPSWEGDSCGVRRRRRLEAATLRGDGIGEMSDSCALGGACEDEEAWHHEWRQRLECWWISLSLPTQTQLRGCMGALGLHLGGRLEMAMRALGHQLPTAPHGDAQDQSQCEWMADGADTLNLPSFPRLGDLEFRMPPIPRLVPSWEQLRASAAAARMAAATARHTSASFARPIDQTTSLATEQAHRSGSVLVGAGVGVGVTLALIVAIPMARWGQRGRGRVERRATS